jgi:hypothetical protein
VTIQDVVAVGRLVLAAVIVGAMIAAGGPADAKALMDGVIKMLGAVAVTQDLPVPQRSLGSKPRAPGAPKQRAAAPAACSPCSSQQQQRSRSTATAVET